MDHHGHPPWHSSGRDIKREVAESYKQSGGDEGLHDVVANVPSQSDLHDNPRVADIVAVSAVVVVEVHAVVKLVQSYIRIYLEINFIHLISFIGNNHLGHGPVEPPHVYLVVGIAEGLELDFAGLPVPGKLVEVHGTGNVEVYPGAVPHSAVIVEPV